MFNNSQLKLLKQIGINIDNDKDYSDAEVIALDDKVMEHFQMHCIDENDDVTQEGLLCEQIVDILSED